MDMVCQSDRMTGFIVAGVVRLGMSLTRNPPIVTGDDARHSHKTGDDWIKEIRKMLYDSEK